jgi:hypothetical protein
MVRLRQRSAQALAHLMSAPTPKPEGPPGTRHPSLGSRSDAAASQDGWLGRPTAAVPATGQQAPADQNSWPKILPVVDALVVAYHVHGDVVLMLGFQVDSELVDAAEQVAADGVSGDFEHPKDTDADRDCSLQRRR